MKALTPKPNSTSDPEILDPKPLNPTALNFTNPLQKTPKSMTTDNTTTHPAFHGKDEQHGCVLVLSIGAGCLSAAAVQMKVTTFQSSGPGFKIPHDDSVVWLLTFRDRNSPRSDTCILLGCSISLCRWFMLHLFWAVEGHNPPLALKVTQSS